MATVEEPKPIFNLRQLADIYWATMKARNAAANRLGAIERGVDDTSELPPEVASYPLIAKLNDAMEFAKHDMERTVVDHPCYDWLYGIPGINRTICCRVLGLIPMDGPLCPKCGTPHAKRHGVRVCVSCRIPQERAKCAECGEDTEVVPNARICSSGAHLCSDFTSFSELRTFAGFCPGRNRLVKGEKAPFCLRLRTSVFVAFSGIMKAETIVRGRPWAPRRFYGEIYRIWRVTYAERHGPGPKTRDWLKNLGYAVPPDGPRECDMLRTRSAGAVEPVSWSDEAGNYLVWPDGSKHFDIGGEIHVVPRGYKVDKKISSKKVKSVAAGDVLAINDWPDGRQHGAAFYKFADVWLSHIWSLWREKMGWPVRPLYVHERLGHQTTYDREDFSSAEMAARKGV